MRRLFSSIGDFFARNAEALGPIIDGYIAVAATALNTIVPGSGTVLRLGVDALVPGTIGEGIARGLGNLAQRGTDALGREVGNLIRDPNVFPGGIDIPAAVGVDAIPGVATGLLEAGSVAGGGIISAINSLIPGGIANLFNLGLGIGAILALGTMLYAGILYSISGDNASQQKESKAWMWAAAKGLALLAFGVILINIINPGLRVIEEGIIKESVPIETQPPQAETEPPQVEGQDDPLVKILSVRRLEQYDDRWANIPYGNCRSEIIPGGLHTYRSSGCGPSALAMAIYFHREDDEQIIRRRDSVITVGNIAVEKGYRVCGRGTAHAAMDSIPELPRFGLTSTRILGQNNISNCIRNNGIVIALMDDTITGVVGDRHVRPIFTSSGHYTVVSGIDEKENKVYITDPGIRNIKSSSISHFLRYNQQSWCIKK